MFYDGLLGVGDDEVEQGTDEAYAYDGVEDGEETREGGGGGEVAESDGG